MTLDPEVCERARLARDARFDGRFFIGVVTTGIYCRPVCPARPAKAANVRFFASAAAAAEAGFRPCLRCRPESSPGTPAWLGTAATVSRALRLIGDGALDDGTVEALAARLGVGPRHLTRLFHRHLGAPPRAVAQTRRLLFAKTLIDDTDLPLAQVALSSGFGSIRRFNAVLRQTYGCAPGALRRASRRRAPGPRGEFVLRLPFRPPFDWAGVIAYLGPRAIPGIEAVDHGRYRRTIALDGHAGRIEVRPVSGETELELRVDVPDPRTLFRIVERVRRLFDLGADPREIVAHLGRDRGLAPLLDSRPGLRLPGAWDGFELAVRAILGQQVTVKGASTLAGRLARAFGAPMPGAGADGPAVLFPTPRALAAADPAEIGLPGKRAAAIRALAAAVSRGEVVFDAGRGPAALERALTRLPGIGGWTAQYVAMRALNEPDAFPATDLGLLRAAERHGLAASPSELVARAEAWRPWRAYAAMALWQSLTAEGRPEARRLRRPTSMENEHVLQTHG